MERDDIVSSILGRALTNAAQSLYDDYVKANASFRSGAGLKAKLIRTMHGHGCPWCRKLAGTYDYEDAPADIYRRHDNCSCTVIYECGKEKQDVWTKQKGDTAEERSQKWEKRKVEIADEEAEKKIAREYRDKSVKKIMEYTPMSPKEASIYYNKNKALIVKYGPEIALRQDGYITNDDILEKIVKNRKTIGLSSDKISGNKMIPYSERGIKLPDDVLEILDNTKESGTYVEIKGKHITNDMLRVLSVESGDEYALIELENKSILIHGLEKSTAIPKEIISEMKADNGILKSHSHPFIGESVPSIKDLETIAYFDELIGQKSSNLVTVDGIVTIFTKNGIVALNSVAEDATISAEDKRALIKLFGGE